MNPMKTLTVVVSLVFACIIVGVGVAAVSFGGSGVNYEPLAIDPDFYVEIGEEEVAYGPSAEVIGPVSGQALATTPVISYDGAICVRYYSTSANSFVLKISANGRTSTIKTVPVDNSTIRIPLLYGEGEYLITLMEMLDATNARTVAYQKVQCGGAVTPVGTLTDGTVGGAPGTSASPSGTTWTVDTTDPYLTPVADIDWSDNLTSVKKARELCEGVTSDADKAKKVYDLLVGKLSYDFSLIGKLPDGYTPKMDTTYSTSKGICYDFASLYAGMMRSVGVKCKMVMGYNTMVDGYHAWNEVYYDNAWHRIDLTIDCQLRAGKAAYGFSTPQGTVTVLKSY